MNMPIRFFIRTILLIAGIATTGISLAAMPEADKPKMPMDRMDKMPGMQGPMNLSVGCSASCASGTVSYTCNASGANASCSSNAARTNAVCTDGNNTTTCNCTGTTQGCTTTTP